MKNIPKILIAIFFVVGVLVHVVGIFYPMFPEPLWSHIVHIISYSLCLFTFVRAVNFRLPLYLFGAAYPMFFHARCFFTQLMELQKFNSVCFLVIVILPLAALLLFTENNRRDKF